MPMTRYKLTPTHKRFILAMMARAFTAYQIAKQLGDQNFADDYDFPKIEINYGSVHRYVKKNVDSDEVKVMRDRFYADFDDVRLSKKKERIIALQIIADASSTSTSNKIRALAAIRAEQGEDIDKLAKALSESGDRTYVTIIGELTDDQLKQVRGNVGVAYSLANRTPIT